MDSPTLRQIIGVTKNNAQPQNQSGKSRYLVVYSINPAESKGTTKMSSKGSTTFNERYSHWVEQRYMHDWLNDQAALKTSQQESRFDKSRLSMLRLAQDTSGAEAAEDLAGTGSWVEDHVEGRQSPFNLEQFK